MAPTTHFSPGQAAAQITRDNYHWGTTLGAATGPVSYGFRSSAPTYNDASHDEQGTFSTFSTQQVSAAESIMRLWSNVARISLPEANAGGTTSNATILFGNYRNSGDGAEGFAQYPYSNDQSFPSNQGDVWMNLSVNGVNAPTAGSYHFEALMHEVGHALGLAHPGDYNAGPGVSITYANDALYVEDSRQYTVMSYFEASETGASHAYQGSTVYASTPLLDDIAALQRLYGANTGFATGNTVYGFNDTGDAAYNIAGASQQVVFSVWDGGGNDTLDFSGYSNNQLIDLTPGSFSNVGALTKNVSIALGTTIENAIGGSGDDQVFGNDSDNRLVSGAGNDSVTGGKGNDAIDGGTGSNTSAYSGASRNYTATVTAGAPAMTVQDKVGSDGTDTLTSIQKLQFTDQTIDTTIFTKTASLSSAQLVELVDVYIAYFNRAPDATGLDFWGAALKDGTSFASIANGFAGSAEAVAAYPPTLSNQAFVTAVYTNVLGRNTDATGLNFWSNQLQSGAVSKGGFILSVIESVLLQSGTADAQYIGNKEAVGAHFALAQGLSNGTSAKTVMAGVNGTAASVAAANALTDGFAATAATTVGTEFVVKILGIVA